MFYPIPFREETRKYLQQLGVNVEYLLYPEVSLAVYLYEHHLPTPKQFIIRRDINITEPTFIYSLSDIEFESMTPYKISRKDYLLIGELYLKDNPLRQALCFQSYQDLKKLANEFPQNYKYFPTKRGILRFLNGQQISDRRLENFLIPLCDYPRRRELISRYKEHAFCYIYQQLQKQFNPEITLSFPAYWFEKDYIERKIKGGKEKLIAMTFIDENLPVTTRKSIWEMLERRDPELIYYSNELILKSIGWDLVTVYEDFKFKRNNFELLNYIKTENLTFDLVSRVDLCPNEHDVFYEEHHGFAITYGRFINFVCFSPEELTAAFVVNEDFVVFRNPREPQRVFSIQEIKVLLDTIKQQRPYDLSQFTQRTEPLVAKIFRGLRILNTTQLSVVDQELKALTGPDREHTVELFEALFRAGMYQRTWRGPNFPYPMKTVETKGSCQKDIEKKMTPELAKIDEEYEKLHDKNLINKTLLLYSATEIYPQQLMDFIRQTSIGEFCVGGGSGLMIETAYHYLTTMGIIIPDFNYQEFEKASTHR